MSAASNKPAAWDPAWEQVFRNQEWGKYPPEHVVRFVARNWYRADNRRSIALLDLGSGPGANAWFATREGFSVSAIDGSATAIAQLRARLAAEGLEADARVGDMSSLPWPDGYFDGVIDNASVYANRFADCLQILSEVHRVLKSGGRFSSALFTDRSWGWGLGRELEPGGFDDIMEGPFAGKGFSSLFGRAQINTLFCDFRNVVVDVQSRTVDGGSNVVEMWIVSCEK